MWQEANTDAATATNKTRCLQDWHVLLQTKLREKEKSTLEGRVDDSIRESLSRVKNRFVLPEMNGIVIARCLCEVLGITLNEDTYQSFFCQPCALDEAIGTFVDCRRLVKAGFLIDRYADG